MVQELDLRGGHVAVDYVNTVAWRGDPQRTTDYVSGYGDLVGWAAHAGVVTPAEARQLRAQCADRPAAAGRAVHDAKRLRETLHAIWARRPETADYDVVSDTFARAVRRRHLRERNGLLVWSDRALTLHTPADRIVVAAVELLQAAAPHTIRSCGDTACGWLFLDTSRRGNRRWCSTAECGNRVRVRRHYERSRNPSGVATNT